jgi:hypothetical protein
MDSKRKAFMVRLFLFVIFFGMIFGCSFSHKTRRVINPNRTLKFTIELMDTTQFSAADSFASELTKRLLAFQDEYRDFRLVQPEDSSDFIFKLKIRKIDLIQFDSLVEQARIRNRIETKYDRLNDSVAANYKPSKTGKIIAANIAANALNIITVPRGFASVSVITDVKDDGPKKVNPNKEEQRSLKASQRTAILDFKATLFNSSGVVKWEYGGREDFTLYEIVKEKEQLRILIRNAVMKIENSMPFLSTNVKTRGIE